VSVASTISTRSRYPGTRPFRDNAEDRALFFGRDEESDQLYLRVLSVSLVLQFAASGLGKTSLLQASLFPRLRQKPFLPVMIRLNVVGESLTRAVLGSFEQACKVEGLEFPEVRTDGLWEFLSTALVWRGDLLLTPVLVFDQFEEVFRLRNAAFRRELAEELGALATGVPPERLRSGPQGPSKEFASRPEVKVVISLREDYLGPLEEFSSAIPNLFHERLRLEPLSEASARDAITKPAERVAKEGEEPYWADPFVFNEAALNDIMRYLKGNWGEIEPFTLQLLCRHAEAIAHEKGAAGQTPVSLTPADFAGVRAFDSVLKDFYRACLAKLPKAMREKAEELCEHGLLDREGRRLLLEEGQIATDYRVDVETLNILAQERLIRRERRLDSVFYEICHDRLAASIVKTRQSERPKKEQRHIRNLWIFAGVASGLCVISIAFGLFALSAYKAAVAAQQAAIAAQQMAEIEKQEADKQTLIAQDAAGEADRQKKQAEASEKRATNAAEVAKLKEEEARDQSERFERLLTFALGEKFLGKIRDAGLTSTLEQVRAETEREAGVEGQGPPLVRGLALRNYGDLERTEGHLQKALYYFQLALNAILSSPDSADKAREIARTRDRIAEGLFDSGKIAAALPQYDFAVETWRRALQSPASGAADAADDCLSLAVSIANSGLHKGRAGQAALARPDLDEAVEIASSVVVGDEAAHPECTVPADNPILDAKAVRVLAETLTSRAEITFSSQDADAAVGLAEKAKLLTPSSAVARYDLFSAHILRGDFQSGTRRLKDYQAALAESDEFLQWDPGNKLWQHDRAVAQVKIGQVTVICSGPDANVCKCPDRQDRSCGPAPSLEEAESVTLDALATLRSLGRSDETNIFWRGDLIAAWRIYGELLQEVAVGRNASDRERAFGETLRVVQEGARENSRIENWDDGYSIEQAAWLLQDQALVLADLGRSAEARTAIQGAVERLKKLATAHPDNLGYRQDLIDEYRGATAILQQIGDKNAVAALSKERQDFEQSSSVGQSDDAAQFTETLKKHRTQGDEFLSNKRYALALEELRIGEQQTLKSAHYLLDASSGYDDLGHIYQSMARSYGGLRNYKAQASAFISSIHAMEINASIHRDDFVAKGNFLGSIAKALVDQIGDSIREDWMLIAARQLVVGANELVGMNPDDLEALDILGMSKAVLAKVLKARDDPSWEEAIRSGLVHVQKACQKNTKDPMFAKDAAKLQAFLAEGLGPDRREDAQREFQSALAAYQEAVRRDSNNKDLKQEMQNFAARAKEFGEIGAK